MAVAAVVTIAKAVVVDAVAVVTTGKVAVVVAGARTNKASDIPATVRRARPLDKHSLEEVLLAVCRPVSTRGMPLVGDTNREEDTSKAGTSKDTRGEGINREVGMAKVAVTIKAVGTSKGEGVTNNRVGITRVGVGGNKGGGAASEVGAGDAVAAGTDVVHSVDDLKMA